MLKYAGLCLIVASSVSAALWNTRTQKNRLDISRAMLDFVMFIENRIIYFHEPLGEIYEAYSNDLLAKSGFLCELLEGSFNAALDKSGIIRCFDAETGRRLREFGTRLGRSGVEEQKANCALCAAALEEATLKLEKELPKKTRMYSSLIIIGGLCAALLLF